MNLHKPTPYIILSINEDGTLTNLQSYYDGYFLLDELIKLKQAVNKTLNHYSENNIDDDFIKNESAKNIDLKDEQYQNRVKQEKDLIISKPLDDLYLIQDIVNNALKIGRSKNCLARFKQLQTSTSHELKLLYVSKGNGPLELELHSLFADHRIKGEWFNFSQEIIKCFNTLPNNFAC